MRTRCTKTLSIRLPGLTAGPGATATFSVIACNVCFQAAAGLIATADMGRRTNPLRGKAPAVEVEIKNRSLRPR